MMPGSEEIRQKHRSARQILRWGAVKKTLVAAQADLPSTLSPCQGRNCDLTALRFDAEGDAWPDAHTELISFRGSRNTFFLRRLQASPSLGEGAAERHRTRQVGGTQQIFGGH